MEIRYHITPAEAEMVQKQASRQIYKGNKLLKSLGFLDLAIFLPYTLLIIVAFLNIGEWEDYFNDYYQNDYTTWIRWILLVGIYVILYYATCFRPRLMNKVFRRQAMDSLFDGEQILRIQEDGLYAKNALAQSVYAYSHIPQVQNLKQYLVVFIGTGHFIAVPHHAFSNENQRIEFENLLNSKIAAYENLSG